MPSKFCFNVLLFPKCSWIWTYWGFFSFFLVCTLYSFVSYEIGIVTMNHYKTLVTVITNRDHQLSSYKIKWSYFLRYFQKVAHIFRVKQTLWWLTAILHFEGTSVLLCPQRLMMFVLDAPWLGTKKLLHHKWNWPEMLKVCGWSPRGRWRMKGKKRRRGTNKLALIFIWPFIFQ